MRAVVLGAGIQGCCAALALVGAGWEVELLDRDEAPMRGASGNGEGKVHLGFVYGNEPSRRTASLMLEGAFSFGPLLERFLAPLPVDWSTLRSVPFHYAVLPGSLVPAAALRNHYGWVATEVAGHVAAGATYLGEAPATVVEEVPGGAVPGVAGPLDAAFRTAEAAVDPPRLASLVAAAVRARGVAFTGSRSVVAVERLLSGFAVECRGPEGTERRRADVVVNCLWDGRLAIDESIGVVAAQPWVHRYKFGVTGTVPPGRPLPASCTFALGPFGDVVLRGGRDVYASWYPTALLGWSTDLVPPGAWRAPGWLDGERAIDLGRRMLDDFAALVPVLGELRDVWVRGGVIVAWGESDIDEPASGLHSRSRVGVHPHDGYVSIDTGKLTTAPLFASRLLEVL